MKVLDEYIPKLLFVFVLKKIHFLANELHVRFKEPVKSTNVTLSALDSRLNEILCLRRAQKRTPKYFN